MDNTVLSQEDSLSYMPEIIGYLSSIKEFEYSYKHYKLGHPGGIFFIITKYVVDDFLEILKELEIQQNNYGYSNETKLEKKLRNLINNIFKFYDSCFEIIQSCCKKHTPPTEGQFTWQWLRDNNYKSGKNFFCKTKKETEIEYYRKIYNKLKHTSNTFRSFDFYKEKYAIMGFYIEGFNNRGSLGPDEEIHPRHEGTHSASSYNFTLKKLYYFLYKISDCLRDILIEHFKDVYNIDLIIGQGGNLTDRSWKELYKKIQKLPNTCFPNEFNEIIYESQRYKNDIVFKTTRQTQIDLAEFDSCCKAVPDGFTRSYRPPFMQKPK